MADRKAAKEPKKEAGPTARKPEGKTQKKPAEKGPAPKPVASQRAAGKKPEARPSQARPETKAPPKGAEPKPAQEARPSGPAWGSTLLFNRWDTSGITLSDPGLREYINLTPLVVPRTGGKYGPGRFQKNRIPIVERFMNKLMVSGHRGRKHKLTSGRHAGKAPRLFNTLKEAFVIIEKKTGKNPVQVLVNAIENSALLEEVASYRLGGIIARNAVITSPHRRLDIALRHLTQGIYRSSFRSRQGLAGVIAEELIAASNKDSKSFAISERNRIEREAEGAR
jgi:small subunit ribosomal protein S7